jgi:hypothetical protein
MRLFLLKIILFPALVISSFLLILSNSDGYTDPFCLRFTTPQQKNLILGNSRAAQGVVPSIFDEDLGVNMYNYSFTPSHSPYGPVYFRSILKKLDTSGKNGLFIITVDPWSISSISKDPNDANKFRENELSLAKTTVVNVSPNFQYLIHRFSGSYFKLLLSQKSSSFLHNDGWLEISVKMDSSSIIERTQNKIKSYRNDLLPNYKKSSLRIDYLEQIIIRLKKQGKVFLVRLPVHEKMLAIENDFMPEFNNIMLPLSKKTNGYFDMTSLTNKYTFTDGNHLYKESGKKVTEDIIMWIENNN